MYIPFRFIFGCLIFLFFTLSSFAQGDDSTQIRKIYDVTLTEGKAYSLLHDLCKNVGHRLSGSANAEKAVQWGLNNMKSLGFDSVWLQPVWVPHWVRGDKEFLKYGKQVFAITALGGSVSTGSVDKPSVLEAKVIEVRSFEALNKLTDDEVKGNIVFYNVPFDERYINSFEAYGNCVQYRGRGAIEAARKGAVACIVRSMTSAMDDEPHTGMMRYDDKITKIPSAAIGIQSCEKLSAVIREEPNAKFQMMLSCKTLSDVLSYNVIGEIRGNEKPNEIIIVGGHLDSWDKGEGAHDDGAGCVQSMEVLHTFLKANYKPKHTIRCILYMNEENGARGAKTYADWALANKQEVQLMALESDSGGHTPHGFGIDGTKDRMEEYHSQIIQYKKLLEQYYIHQYVKGHSGVDVGFLKEQNTMLLGLSVDSQRYFDYHHSHNDTFDKVNRRELLLGAATMASMVYLIDKYGVN